MAAMGEYNRNTISRRIVKDGEMVDNGLHKARIDDREIESYMHIHGIEDISEVKLSYLEVNGQVSFIKKKNSVSDHISLVEQITNFRTLSPSCTYHGCFLWLGVKLDYEIL